MLHGTLRPRDDAVVNSVTVDKGRTPSRPALNPLSPPFQSKNGRTAVPLTRSFMATSPYDTSYPADGPPPLVVQRQTSASAAGANGSTTASPSAKGKGKIIAPAVSPTFLSFNASTSLNAGNGSSATARRRARRNRKSTAEVTSPLQASPHAEIAPPTLTAGPVSPVSQSYSSTASVPNAPSDSGPAKNRSSLPPAIVAPSHMPYSYFETPANLPLRVLQISSRTDAPASAGDGGKSAIPPISPVSPSFKAAGGAWNVANNTNNSRRNRKQQKQQFTPPAPLSAPSQATPPLSNASDPRIRTSVSGGATTPSAGDDIVPDRPLGKIIQGGENLQLLRDMISGSLDFVINPHMAE
ncbi:hypothetical protein BOTBODRAFT_429060 [Botryobasidium botryosum FD-172 SS1]|uniref:Uncharacterized protein n=1 Tax=Botryobasidium botryosum (strain FD-172 SS1) TaxID=930990 RepID=A0A067M8X3_BOTB1|nr:hypothetical protein BOTBODRAFT_429060 [Botryobasidium botryosum FD-172 SS1]